MIELKITSLSSLSDDQTEKEWIKDYLSFCLCRVNAVNAYSDCTKLQGITANHISGKKNVIFVVCSRCVAYEGTENTRGNRIW